MIIGVSHKIKICTNYLSKPNLYAFNNLHNKKIFFTTVSASLALSGVITAALKDIDWSLSSQSDGLKALLISSKTNI